MGRSDVTILGIDTATAVATVAITRAGNVAAERRGSAEPGGRPRHGTELLGEIEKVVAATGGWAEVGLIAVGVGPGTFTGLRIGVATARGLAQARRLPIAGVDSLAALARGIGASGSRPRLALIDARRGEVFAGLYDADAQPIWQPFVAGPEAVGDRIAGLPETPLAAGDGSLRFRSQLESAGAEVLPDADPAHLMAARHVCALGAEAEPARPEQVTPTYLRRPDAEVWREQQQRDDGA